MFVLVSLVVREYAEPLAAGMPNPETECAHHPQNSMLD